MFLQTPVQVESMKSRHRIFVKHVGKDAPIAVYVCSCEDNDERRKTYVSTYMLQLNIKKVNVKKLNLKMLLKK